jgi:hypothetical protein
VLIETKDDEELKKGNEQKGDEGDVIDSTLLPSFNILYGSDIVDHQQEQMGNHSSEHGLFVVFVFPFIHFDR